MFFFDVIISSTQIPEWIFLWKKRVYIINLGGNEKMGSFVQKDAYQVLEAIQEAAEKYDLDVKEIKGRVELLNGNAKEANEQTMFYALNKISHGSTKLDIRCCTGLFE